MNLEGILAIGGKPGLYKLVAQSRSGVIVQSLDNDKRFPVSSAGNVSALQDIAIYTYDEEVPLREIFEKIARKEDNGKAIEHTADPKELRSYMEEILPEYDRERVYNSDLKKLFQWYNLLQSHGLVDQGETDEESTEENSSPEGEQETNNGEGE